MAGMTCNGHAAGFGRMLILPVAAFRDDQVPAIGFDKFDDVTNLHCRILAYIVISDDARACEGGEACPEPVEGLPFYEPEWKRK